MEKNFTICICDDEPEIRNELKIDCPFLYERIGRDWLQLLYYRIWLIMFCGSVTYFVS